MQIPFDNPAITGDELEFLADVNKRGLHLGQGEYSAFCERWISERYSGKPVFLTFSGTTALENVFTLLNLKPGDEVILPSYSFPSCANAVIRAGGLPVLADIDEVTLGLDSASVAQCLTPRTRAILCIHYGGLPCRVEELLSLAKERGIPLIEDAAQAFLCSLSGNRIGSFGSMSILSFNSKKLIHCGQGGAIVFNDAKFLPDAELLRDRGTNRAAFTQGRVSEYSWQGAGTSFSPSELNTAFLKAQLIHSGSIIGRANTIYDRYRKALSVLEQAGDCRLPYLANEVVHNGSLFYLVTNDRATRDALIADLKKHGIAAQFHFVPLHLGAGRELTRTPVSLAVSERIFAGLVRLPLYYAMGDHEVDFVAEKALQFYGRTA